MGYVVAPNPNVGITELVSYCILVFILNPCPALPNPNAGGYYPAGGNPIRPVPKPTCFCGYCYSCPNPYPNETELVIL